MSRKIDAFGEIYMAYLLGEPSNHCTERDDGYKRESESAHHYFRDYDEWESYEQEAIQEARGKILDIGLGAGRHALYLQEKGLEVVGIDTSPLAIEVSKLRGVKDARLMSLYNLNFTDNFFDTILLLGQNLGLGDVEGVRFYLRRLHEITRPDGIILGEARDPSVTDKPEHFNYQKRNIEKGLPAGLVKVRVGFRDGFGEWFDLFLMDQETLEVVIKPTGWKIDKTYQSSHGMYIAILSK
ncbi:methyltransferase domain-containing protein [Candidatus Bathyarchaeota archaeon]|nr:methyltransferase domain-containing protein [Candidatus Bathyarchaeota archaeon]